MPSRPLLISISLLTAHNCRQINAKNQENLDPKKLKLREKRVANSNNGFFVKSGDSYNAFDENYQFCKLDKTGNIRSSSGNLSHLSYVS
jgi:hypothetical protein